MDRLQPRALKAFGGLPVALGVGLIMCLTSVTSAFSKGAELIMFEQQGCEWCKVWNEEIGAVLPKTPEGKCATFSRFDIHNPSSDLLKKIKPIIYTPTFVVLEDGKEVGRVLGYAGEDFFWFQLASQLKKLERKCDLPD